MATANNFKLELNKLLDDQNEKNIILEAVNRSKSNKLKSIILYKLITRIYKQN